MLPKVYLQKMAAAIVKRSGIARPTVEAVLPHVFDEIRYQLAEGSRCVPIESFGTLAVVDIPERKRHYTYGGANEIRTLPPTQRLKFAPARNMTREIQTRHFDPSRKSFSRHPGDPMLRKRGDLRYQNRYSKGMHSTPELRPEQVEALKQLGVTEK